MRFSLERIKLLELSGASCSVDWLVGYARNFYNSFFYAKTKLVIIKLKTKLLQYERSNICN